MISKEKIKEIKFILIMLIRGNLSTKVTIRYRKYSESCMK